MTTHRKPPFRRRRLGKRLRLMRERAGFSLDEAARRLDKSRTALFRIESGENRPDVHVIRSMMDLYDIYEEDLIDEARAALRQSWFTPYGVEDAGYVDVETEACRVREYADLGIPGLLQTEAYMRAVFTRARRRRTPQQVENQVTVRLIRQQRLTSEDNPLELVAIIDEAALRREVGGTGVMRAQMRHLVEAAALPTVTIQVMPLNVGAHSAMEGAFALLDFPDPGDPELLYHEYATGALHIEDEEELREAKLVFDSLRSEALNPAESVALIEQLADPL